MAAMPQLVMPDKAARGKLFHEIDVNGNGGLSLAEIDKAVVSGQIGKAMHCPDFNHKPALMRAYKAADTDGDAFIERREFFKLLKCARRHFLLLPLPPLLPTPLPLPACACAMLVSGTDGVAHVAAPGTSCTSTTYGTSSKRSTAITIVGLLQRSSRMAALSSD